MAELAVTVVLFLLLSGVMAAIEAAVLSVSPGEIEELRVSGARGARAARAVTERITRPLVVIVILTNAINVLGPLLAGYQAIRLFGDVAIGVVTAVLTAGTIVFSEIIPKSVGTHYAPQITRVVAPVLRALIVLLYPVVIAMEWLTAMFKSGERKIGTEAQIRLLAGIGRRAGRIAASEGQIIRRAFFLNDRTAADIMTPLHDVVGLSAAATLADTVGKLAQHSFSRYPVFGDSPDDIRGLAVASDVLTALTQGQGDKPVESVCLPALVVPSRMRCDRLLECFRDRRTHLAVVRKGNRTLGVATLQDVLEQLVGEIRDEKD